VIELDGSQHNTEHGLAYDMDRTIVLRQKYLDVIRFSNDRIDNQFIHVCQEIDEKVRLRINSSCRCGEVERV
jgi:very-short-patch-repair endonuclease